MSSSAQQRVAVSEHSSGELSKLWQQAIEDFTQTSGSSSKQWLEEMKDLSVKDILSKIQEQNKSYADFRKRGEKIREALVRFLNPMQTFVDVAGVAATVAFPPAPAISAAVSFLIKGAKGSNDAYDAVVDLLKRMTFSSQRLSLYCFEGMPKILNAIAMETLKLYLQIFTISIKMVHGNKFVFFAKHTFFGSDNGISAAVSDLSRLTGEENSALSVLVYENQLQSYNLMQQIARFLGVTGEASSKHKPGELVQIDDLRPEFPSKDIFEEKDGDQYKEYNLGKWISEEEQFQSWCCGKFRFLWVCGPPGTGKSYLAYNMIKYMQQMDRGNWRKTTSVAYFFYVSPSLLSAHTMTHALAYQIAKQDESFACFLDGCKDLDIKHTAAILWRKVFKDFFENESTTSSAFLIIYGIDRVEEKERQQFLHWLESFNPVHEDLTPKICIAFVSEQSLGIDLELSFGQLPHCIEVVPQKTKPDIHQYISLMIKDNVLPLRKNKHKELRLNVSTSLEENANGSFLWVNAMIAQLKTLNDVNVIKRCLQNPPMKWREAFKSNLQQLVNKLVSEQGEGELAQYELNKLNYMLAWVTLSPRLVSLRALGQALFIREDKYSAVMDLLELLCYRYGCIFSLATLSGAPISRTTDICDQFIFDKENKDADAVGEYDELAMEDEQSEQESWAKNSEDHPYEDFVLVSLKHNNIRDYFLSGLTKPGLAIQLDVPLARVMVLQTCLQIFCDEQKYRACQESLAYYAARFTQYFVGTDPTMIPIGSRNEIARLLAQLLQMREPLARWIRKAGEHLTHEFLKCPEFVNKAQNWLLSSGVERHLLSVGCCGAWYERLASMPEQSLFEEVSKECARRWLQSDESHPENDVLFLHSYLATISNVEQRSQLAFEQLPQERIEELWDWAKSYTDSGNKVYLYRLASTFIRAGNTAKAVQYGLEATKTDTDVALAHSTLATAYMIDHDIDNACKHLHKSQELQAEEEANTKWYHCLKLYELGAAPMPPGTDYVDSSDLCFGEELFDYYLRREEFENAGKILEMAVKAKASKYWQRFFWDLSRHIGHHQRLAIYAIGSKKNTHLVEQLYKRGLEILVQYQVDGAQPVFAYYHARLHIRLNDGAAGNLEHLEKAVRAFSTSKIPKEYEKVKYVAEMELQSVYLTHALKPLTHEPTVEEVEKAEAYLKSMTDELPRGDAEGVSALALGVWYRHKNQEDSCQNVLRPFFTAAVHNAKELEESACLAFGRPKSDPWASWHKLADALNAAGDALNATAALSYIKASRIFQKEFCFLTPKESTNYKQSAVSQPLLMFCDDSKQEFDVNHIIHKSKRQPAVLECIRGQFPDVDYFGDAAYSGYMCDGCGKVISCCETSYRCTVCIQIDFCFRCEKQLKAKTIGLNVCDSSHSLLQLPPEHLANPRGKIRVGSCPITEESVKLADWLDWMKTSEIDLKDWLSGLEAKRQVQTQQVAVQGGK